MKGVSVGQRGKRGMVSHQVAVRRVGHGARQGDGRRQRRRTVCPRVVGRGRVEDPKGGGNAPAARAAPGVGITTLVHRQVELLKR